MVKVLALFNGINNAVSYYRFINIFQHIIKSKKDIIVGFLPIGALDLEADFSDLSIVHFHASICNQKPIMEKLLQLKAKGVKLVMDIDDYWNLPLENPHKPVYDKILKNVIPKYLSMVDYLTTTTKLFKKELKKFNKNVIVLPNCAGKIECNKQSDLLRIGVITGSSHLHDIKILTGIVAGLGEYNEKIQWVVGGFDTRTLELNPTLSPYVEYEKIFTDDYKIITDKTYLNYLLRYIEGDYPDESQPYRRLWSRDIFNYTQMFNEIDIILAPLKYSKFNEMKSELKIVEAGAAGKNIIASKVGIYAEVIENGITGILCENDVRQWIKAIKSYIDNKPKFTLSEMVDKKYSIDLWAEKRVKFYKELCNE
jgi:glycosyltransferase involved in cell wall biosynthesis